jgi:protein-S-isoprenylcysteine O-methyltransferase Ste14
VILFLVAGDRAWGWGWAFVVLGFLSTVLGMMVMDRSLIVERSRIQPGTKKWDPFLAIFMARIGPMLSLIVAGLDHRFHWSPEMPAGLQPVAFVLAAMASLLVVMAIYANRFFSGTVRIQTDRDHKVIRSWPYSAVRHPGYAGSIITTLATPIILGSYWALIPAVLTVIVIVVRTALEDRTLIAELPGYKEYARSTKHRLLPGIW